MGIQQINPLGVVIGEVKRQHSTGQKESHQDTEACTHTRLLLYVNLIKGKGKKKKKEKEEKKKLVPLQSRRTTTIYVSAVK